MTVGLGIIDTELCQWAGTLTAADMEAAVATPGHPVIKAKPGPVEVTATAPLGLVGAINCWVDSHPILAAALVAGGYWLMRKR